MANKIITFVIDTVEHDLDAILAAAINEIEKEGHKLVQLRVADDSGETLVPPNTVAGVTPPSEPVSSETEAPATPTFSAS